MFIYLCQDQHQDTLVSNVEAQVRAHYAASDDANVGHLGGCSGFAISVALPFHGYRKLKT